MIGLAIIILWFLIGVAILVVVIYGLIWFIQTILVVPIPAKIIQIIWVVVTLLVIIGLLTVLGGGGSEFIPRLAR